MCAKTFMLLTSNRRHLCELLQQRKATAGNNQGITVLYLACRSGR